MKYVLVMFILISLSVGQTTTELIISGENKSLKILDDSFICDETKNYIPVLDNGVISSLFKSRITSIQYSGETVYFDGNRCTDIQIAPVITVEEVAPVHSIAPLEESSKPVSSNNRERDPFVTRKVGASVSSGMVFPFEMGGALGFNISGTAYYRVSNTFGVGAKIGANNYTVAVENPLDITAPNERFKLSFFQLSPTLRLNSDKSDGTCFFFEPSAGLYSYSLKHEESGVESSTSTNFGSSMAFGFELWYFTIKLEVHTTFLDESNEGWGVLVFGFCF